MKRKHRSNASLLFLMELSLAILFFAVSAAVCVQVFMSAHVLSKRSAALSHFAHETASMTGLCRASDSAELAAERLRELYPEANLTGGNLTLYYDSELKPCGESERLYTLNMVLEQREAFSALRPQSAMRGTGFCTLYLPSTIVSGGMAMWNKEKEFRVPLGITSLVVVFLVLCMAVFAMLSLSSAKADLSLTEKDAEHTRAYYEANSVAVLVLDAVEARLAEGIEPSELDGFEIENIKLSVKDGCFSYQVTMSENQAIDVVLGIEKPVEKDAYCEILQWCIIRTDEWEADSSMTLIFE